MKINVRNFFFFFRRDPAVSFQSIEIRKDKRLKIFLHII